MADLTSYPDTDDDPNSGSARDSPPGIPGWVKLFGLVVLALLALLVILIVGDIGGGGHGPGRHTSELHSLASSAISGFVLIGSANRLADPAQQLGSARYR